MKKKTKKDNFKNEVKSTETWGWIFTVILTGMLVSFISTGITKAKYENKQKNLVRTLLEYNIVILDVDNNDYMFNSTENRTLRVRYIEDSFDVRMKIREYFNAKERPRYKIIELPHKKYLEIIKNIETDSYINLDTNFISVEN